MFLRSSLDIRARWELEFRSVCEQPEFSSDTLLPLRLRSSDEEDVRGFLAYCGSESGSCRRFAGWQEGSQIAKGENARPGGSGWLCGLMSNER